MKGYIYYVFYLKYVFLIAILIIFSLLFLNFLVILWKNWHWSLKIEDLLKMLTLSFKKEFPSKLLKMSVTRIWF
jgi:hypothetical protein